MQRTKSTGNLFCLRRRTFQIDNMYTNCTTAAISLAIRGEEGGHAETSIAPSPNATIRQLLSAPWHRWIRRRITGFYWFANWGGSGIWAIQGDYPGSQASFSHCTDALHISQQQRYRAYETRCLGQVGAYAHDRYQFVRMVTGTINFFFHPIFTFFTFFKPFHAY